MKMKNCILSLVAAACLTVTTLGSYSTPSAAIKSSGTVTAGQLDTKITQELQAVLDEARDDDLIPVYIWINDIDYNEVERKTVQASGFSKDTLMEKSNKLYEPLMVSLASDVIEDAVSQGSAVAMSSKDYETAAKITEADTLSLMQDFYLEHKVELEELSDSVDRYISARRSFSQEAHNEQNSDFVESSLKGAKIIFQSEFAPMIICELPKRAIMNLDTLNNVESLSLYEEIELVDEEDTGYERLTAVAAATIGDGVKNIKGDYTRDNSGFNGYGVKVGQIEDNCPQTGVAELANTKITRNDSSKTSAHASMVAAIIAGSTGMAPQAELYSATKGDDIFKSTEWLLDMHVSVINMSAYVVEKPTEVYGEYARWVDYVVNNYGVSWVKSAGNGGERMYVTSPGNAYNVITVGGIDINGTAATGDDIYFKDTNIRTDDNMPSKPEVAAPAGYFWRPDGIRDAGTSYAAPYVTGMVAQMMSCCPTLKLRPDAIKAAVVASCDRKTASSRLDVMTGGEGYGVVNAVNAVNSISNVLTQNTFDIKYDYNKNDNKNTFDFYPLTTGTKTIAIAWLKLNKQANTNHIVTSEETFANFDLYVYDSNGQEVASSESDCNSVEMVRFNATTTNKYTVKIIKKTGGTSKEKISLAHVRR